MTIIVAQYDCRSDGATKDTMSFERGDCCQSWVDRGIFRGQIQSKSILGFEGEALVVSAVLGATVAAD